MSQQYRTRSIYFRKSYSGPLNCQHVPDVRLHGAIWLRFRLMSGTWLRVNRPLDMRTGQLFCIEGISTPVYFVV